MLALSAVDTLAEGISRWLGVLQDGPAGARSRVGDSIRCGAVICPMLPTPCEAAMGSR